MLEDNFNDYWDNVSSDLSEMSSLLAEANDITEAATTEVVSTLNQLLSYYGINPVSSGILEASGYASGTRSLKGSQLTMTSEAGPEAIMLPDGTLISPLPNGSTVFNNGQTGNLYDWSNINPNDVSSAITSPDTSALSSGMNTNVEYNFESLLTVQGNVDGTVINDLEAFAKQFYQGSYDYTIREIARDARKMGIKA